MYELHNNNKQMPNEWQILAKNKISFKGGLSLVRMYCIKKLKMQAKEIDDALQEMAKNQHDSADFGIWKGFIFTYNKDSQ